MEEGKIKKGSMVGWVIKMGAVVDGEEGNWLGRI